MLEHKAQQEKWETTINALTLQNNVLRESNNSAVQLQDQIEKLTAKIASNEYVIRTQEAEIEQMKQQNVLRTLELETLTRMLDQNAADASQLNVEMVNLRAELEVAKKRKLPETADLLEKHNAILEHFNAQFPDILMQEGTTDTEVDELLQNIVEMVEHFSVKQQPPKSRMDDPDVWNMLSDAFLWPVTSNNPRTFAPIDGFI